MRRIAICDDEQEQSELLRGYVKEWSALRGEPVEIHLFPSGEAFLFGWEEEKRWDALLLDIQMTGISGMELARQLRAAGDRLPILFITGVPDYVEEGYEVEALHYLRKPVAREKLFSCLDRAMERSARESVLLLTTVDGEEARFSQKEIAVLEAAGHRVLLTTADGTTTEVKSGFRELLGALAPGEFVQCHRSYVVGLRHVQRLQKEQLILDSGAAVPISRRLFAEVNAAFVRFYKNDA
ncbi:LytR/AlgR family response regulator transcription factor [uncultured Neglectibacter sp.]|uniref:LytR/AlgR family response regulator transcription factor n=1 Tax=uncultured Neglectibacter sp. TaxID=1924108 RepID=UPI0034DEAF5D